MTTRSTKPTPRPPPSNAILRGMAKELKAQRAFAKDAKTPIDSFCRNCHNHGHKHLSYSPKSSRMDTCCQQQ